MLYKAAAEAALRVHNLPGQNEPFVPQTVKP